MGAVLCIVECLGASLSSTHQLPVAPLSCLPNNNQNVFWLCPMIPAWDHSSNGIGIDMILDLGHFLFLPQGGGFFLLSVLLCRESSPMPWWGRIELVTPLPVAKGLCSVREMDWLLCASPTAVVTLFQPICTTACEGTGCCLSVPQISWEPRVEKRLNECELCYASVPPSDSVPSY